MDKPKGIVIELNTIGARLQYLRAANKFTKKDLANSLGISPHTLTKYELNHTTIPSYHVTEYSKAFNVSIDWILTGKEHEQS